MAMKKIAALSSHKKHLLSHLLDLQGGSIFQFKNKAMKLNSPRESFFFALMAKRNSEIHFFHSILIHNSGDNLGLQQPS